jgi:hypothetical protein
LHEVAHGLNEKSDPVRVDPPIAMGIDESLRVGSELRLCAGKTCIHGLELLLAPSPLTTH